jgi:hypothetical protein
MVILFINDDKNINRFITTEKNAANRITLQ